MHPASFPSAHSIPTFRTRITTTRTTLYTTITTRATTPPGTRTPHTPRCSRHPSGSFPRSASSDPRPHSLPPLRLLSHSVLCSLPSGFCLRDLMEGISLGTLGCPVDALGPSTCHASPSAALHVFWTQHSLGFLLLRSLLNPRPCLLWNRKCWGLSAPF